MREADRRVSLGDIADRLQVSKNAVSLALRNKAGVSEELRNSVIKTARELGYKTNRKNGNGFEIIRGNNILVLIPEYIRSDTYFYNEIYWSIEKEAKLRGYNAILTSLSREAETALDMPLIYSEVSFCGVIIIGIFSIPYVKMLAKLELPLLSVDHYYNELPLDAIVTSNIEGAYEVVNHLIECGHTRIGYIGSINVTSSLFERWCGYQKAMLGSGLEIDPSYSILKSSPLNTLLSDIEELDYNLSQMDRFPTAWFCGGDRIAISLINVLMKRGIKVPDDISVAGFDDVDASSLIVPPLTTLRVKRDFMGAEAVDFLINRLLTPGEKIKKTIYGDLVIRDSVKRI